MNASEMGLPNLEPILVSISSKTKSDDPIDFDKAELIESKALERSPPLAHSANDMDGPSAVGFNWKSTTVNPLELSGVSFSKFIENRLPSISKVANFSIDLPDATIAIQVSGAFGSRQEEAQRLGRILRPKSDGRGAKFYSVISRDTIDQDFAQNRQRFLAEQGYSYKIIDADDVFQGKI